MVELPLETPVTTPVEELMVATPVVPLLQVPPVLPLVLRLMVAPVHTELGPLIVPALGTALTVTVKELLLDPQVFVTVYVIILLPPATPVTWPLEELTVATEGVPLLHVPPILPLLLKKMLEPVHTDGDPLIVPALGTVVTEIA